MNRSPGIFAIALIASFLLSLGLSGCTRDPNVRKQKYLASGQRYMAKGKYREAAIQFGNVVRIDQGYAEAHYQLALADLKLGSAQNAYYELRRSTDLSPDNNVFRLELAQLLFRSNHFNEAKEQADSILAKDPNNVGAHMVKAQASAALLEYDVAIAEVSRTIELDPGNAEAYFDLGRLQQAKNGMDPNAEKSLLKAASLDPKAYGPPMALADYYDLHGRPEEAERQLAEAISTTPEDLLIRSALIKHYLRQGKKDQAEQVAKEAKSALGNNAQGSRYLAAFYLSVNNLDAAAAEFSATAKRFPKDLETQRVYLDFLVGRGATDDALKQADAMLKVDPKDAGALLIESALLLTKGKTADAQAVLQTLLKSEPDNAAAHYQLGLTYKVQGNAGQAESQWRQATHLNPGFLAAQKELAENARQKGDFTDLAEIGLAVTETLPQANEGYLWQGAADIGRGDLPRAEKDLRDGIKASPQNAEMDGKLGLVLVFLRRDGEAEPEELQEALKLDPQQQDALQGFAQLDIQRGQPAMALARMQEATAKYPANQGLHAMFAQFLIQQKQMPRAEEELKKVIAIKPKGLDAYFTLAALQFAAKENDDAAATCLAAIQNVPENPQAYWRVGVIYEQVGKTKEAETYYRKALDLQPNLGEAANNLAYLLLQNGGNIDQVISYAETARRQMPGSPAVADTLGWAYYQKGASGLALELLQSAVQQMPNNATYHYHLGLAYSKSGDREHAKSELQRAMQLEDEQSKRAEIQKSLASLNRG